MANFKIGEIAILVGGGRGEPGYDHYVGTEVVIESGLKRYPQAWGGVGYDILAKDGKELFAIPSALRKRYEPPTQREAVGEWELCPWQPQRETSHV